MAAFGAPQVRMDVTYDAALRDEVIRRAGAAGLEAGTLGQRDPALDHGVLIPLYYLRKAGVTCPMLRMGLSAFRPWITTGWASAWQRRRRPWDGGRCLWPAVICPIS